MRWCEENHVDYVLGLARNARLQRILGQELHEAKLQFEATGQASRVFKDFTYQTRKSWSRERRVVGKAEHLGQGQQPAIHRDLAFGRRTRRPNVVRRRVLCSRRDGEPDQGAADVPVRRPHKLRDDASEPVAVVVVERGLHAADGVAAVRTARHGDGNGTLRHDPVEAVEIGGVGADDGSSGVDFVVGELPVPTGVCPGVRELATVVIAAAGLGIRVLGPPSGRFQKTGSLTVCAARVSAGEKRPAVPTSGYRRRPPAADLPSIAPAAPVASPAASSAAATPRGGEKCGLVVAYGPVHTLAWALGMNHRGATWKDLAKRVALLFIVAVLGAALLAAAWKPDFRLKILMFAWVTVLLVIMAAGPRSAIHQGDIGGLHAVTHWRPCMARLSLRVSTRGYSTVSTLG